MLAHNVFHSLGMNRHINPFSKKLGEWKTIINAGIYKTGIAEKRQGYVKYLDNPDTDGVLSLISCEMGEERRLIKITNEGELFSSTPGESEDWGEAILTELAKDKRWGSAIMSDVDGNKLLIMGNGEDVYKTEDGLVFTEVQGAPRARFWEVYKQRVFCSGVDADPDVVHWSSIGDLTDWSIVEPSDSGSINIDRFTKGNVKALCEANNKLVIYKEKGMKRWDEENLRDVLTSWGTEAPHSVLKINGLPFSFDREAIRLYDGNQPYDISTPIKDIIERVNMTRHEEIFAVGHKGLYHLFVGDIQDDDMVIENCVIVYSESQNLFWLYSLGHRMTAGAKVRRKTDNVEKMYFAGEDGQVYEMENGDQDDGKDIEMILGSHIVYPEGITNDIEIKQVGVISKHPNQMKVLLRADYDQEELMGEIDESAQRFKTDKFPKNSSGVSIMITHSTKGRPSLYSYSIGYEVEANRSEK